MTLAIDAHQHLWVYDPREYAWIDDMMASLRRDFLPAELRQRLESNGFQGSIVVQARQTLEETRWLLELAESNPVILGVVGWVDLRSTRLRAELESFSRNPRLVGVRHIVQDEPDEFLLQPNFLRGISILEEFDLAYDILIYTKHLRIASEFVKRFPRQRFVLDHLSKPPIKNGGFDAWASGIRELASYPNVYAKASGLVTEADWRFWTPEHIRPYFDEAFKCFGPGRVMFGSDWPVCTVAGTYERVADLVRDYVNGYSLAERQAVLGGNAAQFYRLKLDR